MDPNPESTSAPQSEHAQASFPASKSEDSAIQAHVLIVDDSYMVAEMLSNFLGKQGCSISYALDGFSALEQIRRRPPDLIIADWVMPSLDGLGLCRQLRQSPEYAWIYYIIMTAREGNDNMERALEAGADEFLSKPFQAAELMTRVRAGLRIVEGRRQQHLLKTGQKPAPSPEKSVGLPVGSRQDLLTRLPLRVAQARSQSEPLSLFGLRLANLSALSQRLDSRARATLFQLLTERLVNTLRDRDDLFCYDEGQFIVLVAGSTLAATQMAAERCCQRLVQDPFVVNGQTLPVQLHFGAASLMENDDPKGVALLRRAAQAMRDSRNVYSTLPTAAKPPAASEGVLKRLEQLQAENTKLRQELEHRLAELKDLQAQNLQLKQQAQALTSEATLSPRRSSSPSASRSVRRRLKRTLRSKPLHKRGWSVPRKALRPI